jgi:hypothetical protein
MGRVADQLVSSNRVLAFVADASIAVDGGWTA